MADIARWIGGTWAAGEKRAQCQTAAARPAGRVGRAWPALLAGLIVAPFLAGGMAWAQSADGTASAAAGDADAVDVSQLSADALISRNPDGTRDPNRGPVTNLPLPRYVSLKGANGNARRGPSLSHRIDWVFHHSGMPLRVTAEFGHWRRVEDQDGAGGWVHYSLLSGVRTALITQDMAELRGRPDLNASVIVRAEAGAIVKLDSCKPDWCRIAAEGEKGWVPKTAIWGVDAAELRN